MRSSKSDDIDFVADRGVAVVGVSGSPSRERFILMLDGDVLTLDGDVLTL